MLFPRFAKSAAALILLTAGFAAPVGGRFYCRPLPPS
jgi:hypothetical protein